MDALHPARPLWTLDNLLGVLVPSGVARGREDLFVTDRGDWFQTYTGKKFYPMSVSTEDIDILDIAHALSLICRYGGHCRKFYSVAEHCVLLSHVVAPEHALPALLHDAAEAYVGDMVRPLKRVDGMHLYRDLDELISWKIAEKFGIAPRIPDEVKEADLRILHDERGRLFPLDGPEWTSISHLKPLGVYVECWKPAEAEYIYLHRFNELQAAAVRRDIDVLTRTSGGVLLTEEVLDGLAAEAEAGYDPEILIERRRSAQ